MKLQTNRASHDALGFGIKPIDNGGTVDCKADTIALSQNLHVVPVVLLANFFGRAAVHIQAIAAEQVIHAPTRGKHH